MLLLYRCFPSSASVCGCRVEHAHRLIVQFHIVCCSSDTGHLASCWSGRVTSRACCLRDRTYRNPVNMRRGALRTLGSHFASLFFSPSLFVAVFPFGSVLCIFLPYPDFHSHFSFFPVFFFFLILPHVHFASVAWSTCMRTIYYVV